MIENATGFDWDEGNIAKCQKQGVSITEIEALFFSGELNIFEDDLHSESEQRFRVIGRNSNGRFMFLGFTLRQIDDQTLVRVITARYMHKKEIENYAQKTSSFEN